MIVEQVSKPFKQTRTFHPVPLASTTPRTGEECGISGWGRLQYVTNLVCILFIFFYFTFPDRRIA